MVHVSRLGRRCREVFYGILSFVEVSVATSVEQSLDENAGAPSAIGHLTTPDLVVQYSTTQLDGTVVVTDTVTLGCEIDVDAPRGNDEV